MSLTTQIDSQSAPGAELRRIGLGIAGNTTLIVASRVLTAAAALVLIPFVVKKLGVGGYGTWEAMVAVSSLSLMPQGAITATAIWQASTAFGAGRPDQVHRAARIGISATLLVFVTIVPLAWAFRGTIVHLLYVSEVLRPAAFTILPALVAVMILGGLTESFGAVITAHQRTGLTNVSNSAALLVNYGVVIAALLRGWGLWSLLFGFVANFAVNAVCLYWIVWRISGPLRILPVVPMKTELHATGSYYGLILAGFISASLRDQTDKIVLASLASTVWVGYYSIASRLAGLVIEVNRFFYVPTLAAVAALKARGDSTSIGKLFSNMMTFGALAAALVVVVVSSQYDRLLVLWMGQNIPDVVPLLLLLLAGNAAAVILTGAGTALCRAVGRVGIETTYVTVGLIANLILTIALVLLIGPIGTVIATAVTWAGSSVVFIIVLHRRLELPTTGTWNAIRAIGAIVVCTVVMRLFSLALSLPLTRSAAFASLCWLVPLTVGLYAVLAYVTRAVTRDQLSTLAFYVRQTLSRRSTGIVPAESEA